MLYIDSIAAKRISAFLMLKAGAHGGNELVGVLYNTGIEREPDGRQCHEAALDVF